jgi:hypothetical protein
MNELQKSEFNSAGYARSRFAYIGECAFEYFIALLVADPFLTKLLLYIGLDDATVSVIQSLISVAFLFQLCSLLVVQRISNVKRVATLIHCIGQAMFLFLYLVPFLPFETKYKGVITVACFLVAYLGNYMVTSVIFRWGNSFVDPGRRARFAATKEMVSLFCGAVVTFVMGIVVDHFEKIGKLRTGFIVTAIVMACVCALDLVCLLMMKNRIAPKPQKGEIEPVFKVVKKLFANKGFLCLLAVAILWQCAHYSILGAIATYKQVELGMTVVLIQIINIAGQLTRFAVSRPIGRFTDKRSYTRGLILGFSLVATAYFINVFTTPETWWLIIGYTLLYNAAMAGIGQNLNNIVYNFVEDKYFVQASALKNSIGGAIGFMVALGSSAVMRSVQANGNEIFGVSIYAQQILSGVAFLFTVLAIIFSYKFLEKRKIIAR